MRNKGGALLGVWLVVNLVAYRLIVRSEWPMGGDAPAGVRNDLFSSLPSWAFPLSLVLALVVPIVVVAAWKALERRTGIDQAMVAAACRWCLDVLKKPVSVVIVLAFVAMVFLPASLFLVPAIVLLLLLPFAVFDARVAASPTGDGWWTPHWPGWKPVLAAVLLLVAVVGVETGMDTVSGAFPFVAPVGVVVSLIVAVIAVTLQGSILLFRLTPGDAIRHLRQILTWQRLGPVLAVHARVAFVALFVVAPLVAGFAILWTLLPSHASWAESQGRVLPWSARLLVSAGNSVEDSGVLGIPLFLEIGLLLLVSRVLWVTRVESAEV